MKEHEGQRLYSIKTDEIPLGAKALCKVPKESVGEQSIDLSKTQVIFEYDGSIHSELFFLGIFRYLYKSGEDFGVITHPLDDDDLNIEIGGVD